MRIAIEALGIGRPGGGRAATLGLLHALLAHDASHHYDLWLDAPEPTLKAPHGNVRQRLVPIRQRFLARLVLQALLPVQLRRDRVDLVHFAKNLTVAATPGRSVVTVYDLHYLVQPDIYPATDIWYWRHVQPRAYRAADHLIAISEQTAADLVRWYGLPRERISVIAPTYDPAFRPHTSAEIAPVRARYGLPERYIAHVGSISPKKNIATLVRAFAQVRAAGYPGHLVLIGARYEKLKDAQVVELVEALGLREVVRFTGAVPVGDMPSLVAGAEQFVFPSLYEGFGIAVLEAMASGVPLVVASGGAVREVVGEAALIAQRPTDADELAALMQRLLDDPTEAEALRRAGLARVPHFRAGRLAAETVALYERVAQERV